jgi:hypothetical protein
MSLDPAPLSEETVERLRFAALAFAVPPSGQRRWVQLGPMIRALAIVDGDFASIPELERDGQLSERQAQLLMEVGARFAAIRAQRDDVFDEKQSGPRSFLWGSTFEGGEWRQLRHVAQECYQLLSEGKDPIIDA